MAARSTATSAAKGCSKVAMKASTAALVSAGVLWAGFLAVAGGIGAPVRGGQRGKIGRAHV